MSGQFCTLWCLNNSLISSIIYLLVVQVAPCSQPSPFLIPQVLFKRVSLPFLSPCSSRSSLPSPRAHLRSLGCSMVLCFPFLIISSSSSYFFLSHSLLLWSLSPFFFSLKSQDLSILGTVSPHKARGLCTEYTSWFAPFTRKWGVCRKSCYSRYSTY